MRRFRPWRLLLLGASFVSCSLAAAGVPLPMKAGPIHTVTDDGAWCWYQDPRAVYVEGLHRRTYLQWVTSTGVLKVGFYDHDTGEMEERTLKEPWDADDHTVGSFLVLPDLRLMVFYARHNKPYLFARTTVHREDITEWEDEVTVSDASHITYSHPVYLRAENRILLFWRGPTWKPTYSFSTDGVSWSPPEVLIRDPAAGYLNRPYFKVTSDGESVIDFAFTDGHPRNEPENSIYYLRYRGGSFYRANGHRVADLADLPIQPRKADVVYDARLTGVRSWVWDIAIMKNDSPVIVYTRLPSESDHRYHYAVWMGRHWRDREIVAAGGWFPQTPPGRTEPEPHYSGGIALNQSVPAEVYLSRPVHGVFEISRWTTSNRGRTWRVQEITRGSTQRNVRPVVPRGYDGVRHVLWMSGEYVFFTNFHTAIRMMVPP